MDGCSSWQGQPPFTRMSNALKCQNSLADQTACPVNPIYFIYSIDFHNSSLSVPWSTFTAPASTVAELNFRNWQLFYRTSWSLWFQNHLTSNLECKPAVRHSQSKAVTFPHTARMQSAWIIDGWLQPSSLCKIHCGIHCAKTFCFQEEIDIKNVFYNTLL